MEVCSEVRISDHRYHARLSLASVPKRRVARRYAAQALIQATDDSSEPASGGRRTRWRREAILAGRARSGGSARTTSPSVCVASKRRSHLYDNANTFETNRDRQARRVRK